MSHDVCRCDVVSLTGNKANAWLLCCQATNHTLWSRINEFVSFLIHQQSTVTLQLDIHPVFCLCCQSLQLNLKPCQGDVIALVLGKAAASSLMASCLFIWSFHLCWEQWLMRRVPQQDFPPAPLYSTWHIWRQATPQFGEGEKTVKMSDFTVLENSTR